MNKPPFYPVRILIGTAVLMFGLSILGFVLLRTDIYAWDKIPTIVFLAAALIMKWAAPKIPVRQLAYCVLVIIGIDAAPSVLCWPPSVLLVGKVTELVCVFGFGSYWVSKNYIPLSANRW